MDWKTILLLAITFEGVLVLFCLTDIVRALDRLGARQDYARDER